MRTPVEAGWMTTLALLVCGVSAAVCAGQASAPAGAPIAPKSAQQGKPATKEQATADAHKLPAERGEMVDRLVAVVNNDIILQSDVEEEERFAKIYPYRLTSGDTPSEQALTRLIDRDLILQQIRTPPPPATDAQIAKDENDLRHDLPACSAADCTSDQGWKKFLTDAGFTEDELRQRLRLREEVLTFIEQRFRSGIRVTDKQIEDFYTNTMLPQYKKEHATPPALPVLSSRIEQVLLEQQVSAQLDQWIKTLRESGSVRILKQGEELP